MFILRLVGGIEEENEGTGGFLVLNFTTVYCFFFKALILSLLVDEGLLPRCLLFDGLCSITPPSFAYVANFKLEFFMGLSEVV